MPLQDTDAILWFGGHSNFTEDDDDSGVILRLTRPRAGEARLMVGVEFYPEGRLSAASATPSPDSSTPRNHAMLTSPEASRP
jgi:hypothetical protein